MFESFIKEFNNMHLYNVSCDPLRTVRCTENIRNIDIASSIL
jgi:hypothetical protein